jgi:hypothetical protein
MFNWEKFNSGDAIVDFAGDDDSVNILHSAGEIILSQLRNVVVFSFVYCIEQNERKD